MAYQAKELPEEDIKKIRESQDGIMKLAKAFGVHYTRIEAIRKAESLDKALEYAKGMPKEDRKGVVSAPAVKSGGELATVVQPAKGAIQFIFDGKNVNMNPFALVNAYGYYLDIIAKNGFEQDFSSALEDGMRHVWRDFNRIRAEQGEISITKEA